MPEFNSNKVKPFYFKLNRYSVIILDVKNEINPNRTIKGVPKIQSVKEVLSVVPSVASPAALSTSPPPTNTTTSNHDNYYDTRSSVESSSDEDDNINHNNNNNRSISSKDVTNSNNVESSDNNSKNNNSTYQSKQLNFGGDNNISSNNQREEDLVNSGEENVVTEMEVETENKTYGSNNSTNVVLKGLKNVENFERDSIGIPN